MGLLQLLPGGQDGLPGGQGRRCMLRAGRCWFELLPAVLQGCSVILHSPLHVWTSCSKVAQDTSKVLTAKMTACIL